MVGSGLIHLYLWHLAYRHVATLGPLFLVQAIAGLVLAVALASARRGFLMVAGLGLMVGTIVGFILVTTVGLFGFTLTTITGWAVGALLTEAGGDSHSGGGGQPPLAPRLWWHRAPMTARHR